MLETITLFAKTMLPIKATSWDGLKLDSNLEAKLFSKGLIGQSEFRIEKIELNSKCIRRIVATLINQEIKGGLVE